MERQGVALLREGVLGEEEAPQVGVVGVEEAFHLQEVEAVEVEGQTPTQMKERVLLGLPGSVHLRLKHQQSSEKRKQEMRRFLEVITA